MYAEMGYHSEKEWYFFSPRDRKYPNGSRPNRAAGSGYWKATGADKPIGKVKPMGIKKALVFYAGKAPKGVKTNWIMHEYRLANVDRSAGKKNNLRVCLVYVIMSSITLIFRIVMGGVKVFVEMLERKNLSDFSLFFYLQLDDWVLCRIYNKKGKIEKFNTGNTVEVHNYYEHEEEEHERKPEIQKLVNYQLYMDTSDSVPKLHTDSSSSGHVVSPDVTCDREVQSEPKWNELGIQLDNAFGFEFNYLDNNTLSFEYDDDPFGTNDQYQINQLSPLQDMFMYQQKPF